MLLESGLKIHQRFTCHM